MQTTGHLQTGARNVTTLFGRQKQACFGHLCKQQTPHDKTTSNISEDDYLHVTKYYMYMRTLAKKKLSTTQQTFGLSHSTGWDMPQQRLYNLIRDSFYHWRIYEPFNTNGKCKIAISNRFNVYFVYF